MMKGELVRLFHPLGIVMAVALFAGYVLGDTMLSGLVVASLVGVALLWENHISDTERASGTVYFMKATVGSTDAIVMKMGKLGLMEHTCLVFYDDTGDIFVPTGIFRSVMEELDNGATSVWYRVTYLKRSQGGIERLDIRDWEYDNTYRHS